MRKIETEKRQGDQMFFFFFIFPLLENTLKSKYWITVRGSLLERRLVSHRYPMADSVCIVSAGRLLLVSPYHVDIFSDPFAFSPVVSNTRDKYYT